nr:PREDICTED: nuclear pore complex protein Nup155 [Bemisia tabaci]
MVRPYNITANAENTDMGPTSESLEFGSNKIDEMINSDSNSPLIVEREDRNEVERRITVSGLKESDYPKPLFKAKLVKTTNKISLPPEIMQHLSSVQCQYLMGVFPELSRVWVTVDSDFYIWDYKGADLAFYDGLSETIMCVGLVKPKPNVFKEFITHLLVLATTVDIVVLGVTLSVPTDSVSNLINEIHFTPEVVFQLPTDGVNITAIAGSANGRIFLGGEDGNLYEIQYRKELDWWGKRCSKVNHSGTTLSFLLPSVISSLLQKSDSISQISIDNSRKILYTLSEKGTIDMYILSSDSTATCKASLPQHAVIESAIRCIRTMDRVELCSIVSICAVEEKESKNVGLLAVTQAGVRFYFQLIYMQGEVSDLKLIHVRLPPGFIGSVVSVRPNDVRQAYYNNGIFMALSTVNESQDNLWCLSSEEYLAFDAPIEAQATVKLDGPVWQFSCADEMTNSNAANFVSLSAQGIQLFSKLRPVEVLAQLLWKNKGPNADAVRAFFQNMTDDESCALCISIACQQCTSNVDLANWATQALFLYGGEPKEVADNNLTPAEMLSVTAPQSSFQTTNFRPGIVSTPIAQTRPNILSETLVSSTENIIYEHSAKHNGLYLYLSRILRPLWQSPLVKLTKNQDNKQYLTSTVSAEECVSVLSNLQAFWSFLEKNSILIQSFAGPAVMSRLPSMNMEESTINSMAVTKAEKVHRLENRSLEALKVVVDHACQIVGLWKVLCEHQFHQLVAELSPENQRLLVDITLKQLLVSKHELCITLVNTLLNLYLKDDSTVDSISCKLRGVCPLIFRDDDASYAKANEMLLTAKSAVNPEDKQKYLTSALQLCIEAAPNICLSTICRKFAAFEFYEAVLIISLSCASKYDPRNFAINYYYGSEYGSDSDAYQFYNKRMECYKEIIEVLTQLFSQNQPLTSPGSSTDASRLPKTNSYINQSLNRSQLSSSQTYQEEIEAPNVGEVLLQKALSTDDELLHVALYEWMIQQQLQNHLVELSPPTVERFLKKNGARDLLWRYYERQKNHVAATKILYSLATEVGSNISLEERLSFLGHALVCVRSDPFHRTEYAHEIEDLMQVAQVQRYMFDQIVALANQHPNAEAAAIQLQNKLYSATELYLEYAVPFELWESQLAIIDMSGHQSMELVREVWSKLLDETLNACTSSSGTEKLKAVLQKVQSLSRVHTIPSPCFPLDFLIGQLEVLSCRFKAPADCVYSVFLQKIGVSYPMLLDVYQELYTSGDWCWDREGNEFHLMEVITSLGETFFQVSHKDSMYSACFVKLQDLISSCLAILYTRPEARALIERMKNVRNKLNKLS